MGDRENIIERLSLITEINDGLMQTLHIISREIQEYQSAGPSIPVFTDQLLQYLIPLICEDLIQKYNYEKEVQSKKHRRQNASFEPSTEKNIVDQVMNTIVQLIVKLCYNNIAASERVLELILTHVDRHKDCTNCYLVLMRIMNLCPYLRESAVNAELGSILVEILEHMCGEPELPPVNTHANPRLSQRRGSEEAPPTTFPSTPNVPAEYRTTLNKSINNMNDSFVIELPAFHGHSSRALRRAYRVEELETPTASPVVPMLNLPTSLQESTHSKSSRRQDISTRSGRLSMFSGSWGDRIDLQSPVTTSPYAKPAMAFDFDTSFYQEESTNVNNWITAQEKLRYLALQLGESCLTADMTALISQKRALDLERIAKMTVLPGKILKKEDKSKEKQKNAPHLMKSHSLTSLNPQMRIDKEKINAAAMLTKSKKTVTPKLRATVLSLLSFTLDLYDLEQLHNVRSPINILFGHLLSSEQHHLRITQNFKKLEKSEFSDDEDIYDGDAVSLGIHNPQNANEKNDLEIFKQKREDQAFLQQGSTVAGIDPRGAKPYNEKNAEDNDESMVYPSFELYNNDTSMDIACFKATQQADLIKPEPDSINIILKIYANLTEFSHRQAVAPPSVPMAISPSIDSSMICESPKRPVINPIPMVSNLDEAPPFMWVNGISWRNISETTKYKLRKHSDLFLWRLSRRLAWAQDKLEGQVLVEAENDLLDLLANYLHACRSRVMSLQTIDVTFEQLINTKKRLLEFTDSYLGSRPPSPTSQSLHHPQRGAFTSFLRVLTELVIQNKTVESAKLLTEVFICNDAWNECAKSFTLTALTNECKNEFQKTNLLESRTAIKYYNAIAVFFKWIIREMNLDRKTNQLNSTEKYWKFLVRRTLGAMMWLTSPNRGILPKYLHKFGAQRKPSPLQSYSPVPRNLPLTRGILELLSNLFWFPARFSCFKNEEHALFYIRMHYLSFLKLYTSNNVKTNEDIPLVTKTVAQSATFSINETEKIQNVKNSSLLCKFHIKCLFAIARCRSPDITRKFYQFRIIEFLTREIDLEYDICQRRNRFLQVQREEKEKMNKVTQNRNNTPTISKEEPIIKQVGRVPSLKLDMKAGPKIVKEVPALALPTDALADKPKAPSFKLDLTNVAKTGGMGGLGLNLDKLGGPTEDAQSEQVENDNEAQIEEEKTGTGKPPPHKNLLELASGKSSGVPPLGIKPVIPALKMGALKLDLGPKKPEIPKMTLPLSTTPELEAKGELTKLEKSLNKNSKMQLFGDFRSKQEEDPIDNKNMWAESEFYERERKNREIYVDEDLHVSMVALIFCLLLTPTRGTLDEQYCSQFPIINGKPNVLFLMHYHLNHPANQDILPRLFKLVGHIVPSLAGHRLLKLLSAAFFNSDAYKLWRKIETGAYGTVYECSTGLDDPECVAIKKMSVPREIEDRCVLHDIFNEISCLEELRLEGCVCDLYDYGVDSNDYYIVMKYYPNTVKRWRKQQQGGAMENLVSCLSIFREILCSVQVIHTHHVTHYDLKCDNVFLDFQPDPMVILGDFGECRMFVAEEDEVCLRNRGTDYIKSPEMLQLTIAAKKETNDYDRRRRVGTTRLSDIWSLGCLLFELLTGEFLFYHDDWVHFYIRVTSLNEDLLTQDKLDMINNNIYLVDFLKYMLVREPRHRPSINNVLKRFEHVHALLVTAPSLSNRMRPSIPHISTIRGSSGFESVLDILEEIQRRPNSIESVNMEKHTVPSVMKITSDIFLCRVEYLKKNSARLIELGISHIVHDCEEVVGFRNFIELRLVEERSYSNLAMVMDFLRHATITHGRVAFCESDELVVRESLTLALSTMFQTTGFETWSLINSQTLFYTFPQNSLTLMSTWTHQYLRVENYLSLFPRFQCHCGSCTLVLKRHLADPKNQVIKECTCSRQLRNVETSKCPSSGCADYLAIMKDMYSTNHTSLIWGFADRDDFMVGPNGCGDISNRSHRQIALASLTIDQNAEIVKCIDKRPWLGMIETWRLYKCRLCHCWLFAVSADDRQVAYIMNNKVTGSSIMTPKRENFTEGVRVPVLRNLSLNDNY